MDIRKEDISKMRLRVGICNNEIINAQTELVISHIKKVHKDVSFTKFDIGGGRHFNTSGIAGVPENVLCNMNDVVPWSVAVSDAISAGYIDVGVTGLNELFANDMSEILKQGVTLSAITKRRDTRAVLITKKKRRSADTDNKVKLYTDNYDKLKRCRYIYDNTSCQLLDTIEDCIDMLMENEEAFKLSYIENALTSNQVLSKLATNNPKDIYGFVEMAKGAKRENVTLEGNYSIDEINEYISVLEELFKVRDIVLKVNLEYIYSAGQADEYRSEPAFKLQGSYRNMNKIAEKILPIMNDEELFQRIIASYENDSQTLTNGAEANMLKWKEIVGCITEEEKARYEEIKSIYNQNKLVKGDDMLGQAVMALGGIAEKLNSIKEIFNKW